ncbi:precorrin-6A synthase (deacetylating) [Sphingomonas sp. PR090111-T3T-6A]|uniref:precorrin-6A synthase (deacetylating) n=1 Tax=Sphingomonas sp. PR090111-T3T-6A TaxID=685778 RepID=UPI00037EA46C|nr:precorrin-6A synthase (deacetylating) [Sphingomonas sp. PR090111-T3T-6A]
MIRLALVGIGTGNPDHLTLAAIKAMNAADLILLPRKEDAKSDLLDLRRTICAELLTGPARVVEFDMPERAATLPYLEAVDAWHDAIAAIWMREIGRHLPEGGSVALLVWGDPSLYDSSLRISTRLGAAEVQVVPGITSIQALTAAHGICLNELARPVLITTGRWLHEQGWPDGTDSVVVMLDGGCAFQRLTAEGISIWWGAYLAMPQEALIHGPLATAGPEIVARRAELRQTHGWIMDTYLLRRAQAAPSLDASTS